MQTQSLRSASMNSARRARRDWQPLALLALGFFLLMFFFYPFREVFEYDHDEGGNLMQSLLIARGYPLYSEIWNDQPPIFTNLLALGIRAVNAGVDEARLLVLLFSTAMLAGAAHILQAEWGLGHAIAGVFLIVLLPYFIPLSTAVMFGLPAIALAVLSLAALVFWHRTHKRWLLVLSALILSLSVFTKLFTGFLAPIFALGILMSDWRQEGRVAAWRSLLLWSVAFGLLCLVIIVFLIGPANLGELVFVHLEARETLEINTSITGWLGESWPLFIVVIAGGVLAFRERRWLSLYLIAWMSAAYLLLNLHAPVFYHHQLLVTIPSAMLAGIALGELPRLLRERPITGKGLALALLTLAGFGLYLVMRLPASVPDFIHPPSIQEKAYNSSWSQEEQAFMIKIARRAAETRWVVTDMPMYAFRVGLVSPPHLSFVTLKRLSTQELTEEKMIAVIQEYRPEQVLLGRRDFPTVRQFLETDYRLLYERGKRYLYLRKDLKGQ